MASERRSVGTLLLGGACIIFLITVNPLNRSPIKGLGYLLGGFMGCIGAAVLVQSATENCSPEPNDSSVFESSQVKGWLLGRRSLSDKELDSVRQELERTLESDRNRSTTD